MNNWADEPTLEDVQREYPDWACRRDISGMLYARRRDDGHEVKGEDATDLRDQIRGAIGQES